MYESQNCSVERAQSFTGACKTDTSTDIDAYRVYPENHQVHPVETDSTNHKTAKLGAFMVVVLENAPVQHDTMLKSS